LKNEDDFFLKLFFLYVTNGIARLRIFHEMFEITVRQPMLIPGFPFNAYKDIP